MPFDETKILQINTTLAAAGSAGDQFTNQTLQLDGDAPFELYALYGQWTASYWSIDIQLPSGRRLSTAPIFGPLLFGSCQFPFALLHPEVYPAKGTIRYSIQNLTNSANTLNLALLGLKKYA